jgi:hypothetical protein
MKQSQNTQSLPAEKPATTTTTSFLRRVGRAGLVIASGVKAGRAGEPNEK